ncbi:MAG: hypothetical protein GY711_20370 [bacterium]|nr:hypothetical protein [bacterium]
MFYLRTTRDAPRGRLVTRHVDDATCPLHEVVPQTEHNLTNVSAFADRLCMTYMVDARPSFRFVSLDGEHLYDLELPGNTSGFADDPDGHHAYFTASYLFDPGTLYRLDVRTGEYEVSWRPRLRHDPEQPAARTCSHGASRRPCTCTRTARSAGPRSRGTSHTSSCGWGAAASMRCPGSAAAGSTATTGQTPASAATSQSGSVT